MRDTAFVSVVPADPFSVGGPREAASPVQDLISIATHRAAGVIWLRVEVAETEPALLPDGRPAPRRCADVLYSPAALGRHDAKAIDHHRVFFTCESLPFEKVMARWYEAHGRLQAATNMILGLRYAPARYVENNLLTAVGAAEVLHRGLRIDEKPYPTADFNPMRDVMLKQVPEKNTESCSRERSATTRRSGTACTPSPRAPISKRSPNSCRMINPGGVAGGRLQNNPGFVGDGTQRFEAVSKLDFSRATATDLIELLKASLEFLKSRSAGEGK